MCFALSLPVLIVCVSLTYATAQQGELPSKHLCNHREHFVVNSSVCQVTCFNRYLIEADSVCVPVTGCVCNEEYLRLHDDGTGPCITEEECPPDPIWCGPNEVETNCVIVCPPQSCESIYLRRICLGEQTCNKGCNCVDGYLRNSIGICIPRHFCPIPHYSTFLFPKPKAPNLSEIQDPSANNPNRQANALDNVSSHVSVPTSNSSPITSSSGPIMSNPINSTLIPSTTENNHSNITNNTVVWSSLSESIKSDGEISEDTPRIKYLDHGTEVNNGSSSFIPDVIPLIPNKKSDNVSVSEIKSRSKSTEFESEVATSDAADSLGQTSEADDESLDTLSTSLSNYQESRSYIDATTQNSKSDDENILTEIETSTQSIELNTGDRRLDKISETDNESLETLSSLNPLPNRQEFGNHSDSRETSSFTNANEGELINIPNASSSTNQNFESDSELLTGIGSQSGQLDIEIADTMSDAEDINLDQISESENESSVTLSSMKTSLRGQKSGYKSNLSENSAFMRENETEIPNIPNTFASATNQNSESDSDFLTEIESQITELDSEVSDTTSDTEDITLDQISESDYEAISTLNPLSDREKFGDNSNLSESSSFMKEYKSELIKIPNKFALSTNKSSVFESKFLNETESQIQNTELDSELSDTTSDTEDITLDQIAETEDESFETLSNLNPFSIRQKSSYDNDSSDTSLLTNENDTELPNNSNTFASSPEDNSESDSELLSGTDNQRPNPELNSEVSDTEDITLDQISENDNESSDTLSSLIPLSDRQKFGYDSDSSETSEIENKSELPNVPNIFASSTSGNTESDSEIDGSTVTEISDTDNINLNQSAETDDETLETSPSEVSPLTNQKSEPDSDLLDSSEDESEELDSYNIFTSSIINLNDQVPDAYLTEDLYSNQNVETNVKLLDTSSSEITSTVSSESEINDLSEPLPNQYNNIENQQSDKNRLSPSLSSPSSESNCEQCEEESITSSTFDLDAIQYSEDEDDSLDTTFVGPPSSNQNNDTEDQPYYTTSNHSNDNSESDSEASDIKCECSCETDDECLETALDMAESESDESESFDDMTDLFSNPYYDEIETELSNEPQTETLDQNMEFFKQYIN